MAAEQRIGEILLSIPKASGRPSENSSTRTEKLKSEVASEMGYSKDDVSDYQNMAKHPEVVQAVMDNALKNGEVVTKASVMKEIRAYKERIKELESREPEMPSDYTDMKLKLKPIIAEKQRQRQVDGGKEKVQQNSVEATTTQNELATIAGVSHGTHDKKKDFLAKKAEEKIFSGKADPDKNSCQGYTPQERNKTHRENKTDYKIAKAAGTSDKNTQCQEKKYMVNG